MSEKSFVAKLFRRDSVAVVSKKEEDVADKDPRHPGAHPRGGMTESQAIVAAQRRVAFDIIKQIGMNVLRGKDLLYVTFPAKCSEPTTVLQNLAKTLSYSDHFLVAAGKSNDPVERLVRMAAVNIAGLHLTSGARKPLNPTIGETHQAQVGETSHMYIEQASHHPPITTFQVRGEGFEMHGDLCFSAKFGVNELRLINKGLRTVEFDDGSSITVLMPRDLFNCVMMGVYRHDIYGAMKLEDVKNGLSCEIIFGKNRNLPSDYFRGQILKNGVEAGIIEGSWLSCLDYNGRRVWSIEDSLTGKLALSKPGHDPLPTDSRHRADVIAMTKGDMMGAEDKKKIIEESQRRDRKLRTSKA